MNVRSNFPRIVMGINICVFTCLTIAMAVIDAKGFDKNPESVSKAEFSIAEEKAMAVADGDTVVVTSTGADFRYDVTEIRAEAGSTLTIRFENRGEMPHNIVLLNERADINPVGIAGIQAMDTDYIPQDDANQERIIANTALAKPGDTVFVTFTVPPPGTYPYICTYPGHFTMMQGDLISK